MLISNLQYTLIPIYQYTSNLQRENSSLPPIPVDSTHLKSGRKGNNWFCLARETLWLVDHVTKNQPMVVPI